VIDYTQEDLARACRGDGGRKCNFADAVRRLRWSWARPSN